MAGTPFARLEYGPVHPLGNAYADGLNTPARPDGPNPRLVSNTVSRQDEVLVEPLGFNQLVPWWLFMVHIDIAVGAQGDESTPIPVPLADDPFDIGRTGTAEIAFRRSLSTYDLPVPTASPAREIIDFSTAFLDGDPIYRRAEAENGALRAGVGGRVILQPTASGEDVMPSIAYVQQPGTWSMFEFPITAALSTAVSPVAPGAAIHTLLMREHNRVAAAIDTAPVGVRLALGLPADPASDPERNDEAVFQLARRVVEAEIQAITYGEVLPAVGVDLGRYVGYDADLDPEVSLELSTGPLRLENMTGRRAPRVTADGTNVGSIDLADPFGFGRGSVYGEWIQGGVDDVIRGMMVTPAQANDLLMDEGLRSIAPEVPVGTVGDLNDLTATHIQRGRDRGLPDYGDLRIALGLPAVTSFADVTSDAELQTELAGLYGDPASLDPIVGMLAEDRIDGAMFGPTGLALYELQFTRTRSSDRLWYQATLADSAAFRLAIGTAGLEARNQQGTWELERTLGGLIRDTTSLGGVGDVVSRPISPGRCSPPDDRIA